MKLIVFLTLVHKIDARHQLLEDTITVRDDETESYNMAIYLNNCLTPIFLAALILEMTSFFLYINLVKKHILFSLLILIFPRTRTIKKVKTPSLKHS